MGYGQDSLSGQQLVSQLRGDSEGFPHLDNIMTTAYNTAVPELNLAVIKQTIRKQKLDEVIYDLEKAPIHRRLTAPLSSLTRWICLFLNQNPTVKYGFFIVMN